MKHTYFSPLGANHPSTHHHKFYADVNHPLLPKMTEPICFFCSYYAAVTYSMIYSKGTFSRQKVITFMIFSVSALIFDKQTFSISGNIGS